MKGKVKQVTDHDSLPDPIRRFVTYKTVVQGRAAKTVNAYAYDLTVFFSYLSNKKNKRPLEEKLSPEELCSFVTMDLIEKITKLEILEYLFYANSLDNKAATRARKLSSIRSFYKYLYKNEGSIKSDPAQDIETPHLKSKNPKFLDESESVELLSTAAESDEKNAVRNYCIITLFLNCGMRVSELCGISMGDFSDNYTKVRVTGKGSKERILYLNDACQKAVRDYIKVRSEIPDIKKEAKDAFFISRNKRRIAVKTVQWVVYKYVDMAGLGGKGISAHKLRHTAATLMYQSGKVDIRTIKDILGHEQLNTTQIYTHVSSHQMAQAVQANPLSGLTRSNIGKSDLIHDDEDTES